MNIEIFHTPLNSPVLIGLIALYFFSAAITTFDTRIIQAQRSGHLASSDLEVPAWTGIFTILLWLTFAALLLLNPLIAVILFAIKFILKVLPVLENIGAILMIPVVGTTSISAVNVVAREQRMAKKQLHELTESWKKEGTEEDADG